MLEIFGFDVAPGPWIGTGDSVAGASPSDRVDWFSADDVDGTDSAELGDWRGAPASVPADELTSA